MKRKDIDKIPCNWKCAVFLIGFTVFYFAIEFLTGAFNSPEFNDLPRSQVAIRNESGAVIFFLFGLTFLRNYILNEEGITCRFLCIPYRKIKWESVAKVVVCRDSIWYSTMLVFNGCPVPNAEKNQKYDRGFAVRHLLKTYKLFNSKKHIHLIEKYWPGEIENKYLLYQKKK